MQAREADLQDQLAAGQVSGTEGSPPLAIAVLMCTTPANDRFCCQHRPELRLSHSHLVATDRHRHLFNIRCMQADAARSIREAEERVRALLKVGRAVGW